MHADILWNPVNELLFVIVIVIVIFFLENSVQGGMVQMRLTLCEATTRETRPDHNTGN